MLVFIIVSIILLFVVRLLNKKRKEKQESTFIEKSAIEDPEGRQIAEEAGLLEVIEKVTVCQRKPVNGKCPPKFVNRKNLKGEDCCFYTGEDLSVGGQVVEKLKMGGELAGSLAIGYAADKLVSRIVKKRFATSAQKKVMAKTAKKAVQKSGQRLGRMFAMRGVKLAAKTSAKLAGKAAAKAASGPVGWALLAFDLASAGLDIADVGGYDKIQFNKAYIDMKKDFDKIFIDEIENEGMKLPIVYGPLHDLPDVETEKLDAIVIDKVTGDVLDKIWDEALAASNADPSIDFEAEVDRRVDEMESKMDELVFKEMCEYEGKISTGNGTDYYKVAGKPIFMDNTQTWECSYKDMNACEKWPLQMKEEPDPDNSEKTIKIPDELYREWRNNQCEVASPTMRLTCEETEGVTFDKESGLCKTNQAFCESKGGEWVYDNNLQDHECIIPAQQQVMEFFFGTTITRGLKSIGVVDPITGAIKNVKLIAGLLDPNNYKPCEEGWIDDGLVCRKVTCPKDKPVLDAGLCYKACEAGSYGVGPLCWKECPEGETNTGTGCTKTDASYGRGVGTIPVARCKEGEQLWGGLCYKACDTFGDPDLSGQRTASLTCACKENRCWPFGVKTDIEFGTDGSGGVARIPEYKCPDDKEDNAGLCYPKCKPGYHGKGPVCWKECPPGFTDIGLFCQKPAPIGRGVGVVPEKIEVKGKELLNPEKYKAEDIGRLVGDVLTFGLGGGMVGGAIGKAVDNGNANPQDS